MTAAAPKCEIRRGRGNSKMLRLIKWTLVHLCLPLCLLVAIGAASCLATKRTTLNENHRNHLNNERSAEHSAEQLISRSQANEHDSSRTGGDWPKAPPDETQLGGHLDPAKHTDGVLGIGLGLARGRRSLPWATILPQQPARAGYQASLTELADMRAGKLEPPSRPSSDWSKQRPYFGTNLQRNVSVELGKTAHLLCKVFELGDKTVSWLRPRENEILTAGEYTYVSDPRISATNENGGPDWVLEIKDVGPNDSASYECQVSTDPKLSQLFNLHVQAARARIRPAENNYYPTGSSIEFACEILPPLSSHTPANQRHRLEHPLASPTASQFNGDQQQIYWYHNGDLLNYRSTPDELARRANMTIDWDRHSQMSRLKLSNIQPGDSGNYTCKPTSAEPATVRLFVKKQRPASIRASHGAAGNSLHSPNSKEAQRTRQHYEQAEFTDSSISCTQHVSLFFLVLPLLVACLLLQRPSSLDPSQFGPE